MKFGRFDEEVWVLTRSGKRRCIHSASQAIDYLSSYCKMDAEAELLARNLCKAVLQDLLHPKVARRAFERAIRGSNLLAEDGPSDTAAVAADVVSSRRLRYSAEYRRPLWQEDSRDLCRLRGRAAAMPPLPVAE